MISEEELMTIHVLHQQGYSQRAIARKLGISRNTVIRYLKTNIAEVKYSPRPQIASKLDAYKPYLHSRIAKAAPIYLSGKALYKQTSGIA